MRLPLKAALSSDKETQEGTAVVACGRAVSVTFGDLKAHCFCSFSQYLAWSAHRQGHIYPQVKRVDFPKKSPVSRFRSFFRNLSPGGSLAPWLPPRFIPFYFNLRAPASPWTLTYRLVGHQILSSPSLRLSWEWYSRNSIRHSTGPFWGLQAGELLLRVSLCCQDYVSSMAICPCCLWLVCTVRLGTWVCYRKEVTQS